MTDPTRFRILLVEDETTFLDRVHALLVDLGSRYEVTPCASVESADTWIMQQVAAGNEPPCQLAIIDVGLPDPSEMLGIDLARRLRKRFGSATSVLIMTGLYDEAVQEEAWKARVQGVLMKCKAMFAPEWWRERLEDVERLYRYRLVGSQVEQRALDRLVGNSPGMIKVKKQVERYAASPYAVLILGESGVGKELTARALHEMSPRSNGPYLPVNCTDFTESLLEAELFGHEKGAGASAYRQHVGVFERACGGTVFLDEIADASAALQAKLLRVIQEGTVTRVGGEEVVKVDFRLVSGTNKDLKARVAQHAFREDLYYRIAVTEIVIPPLRDREEDLEDLLEAVSRTAATEYGVAARAFDASAVEALRKCRLAESGWQGNVRDLYRVACRLYVHTDNRSRIFSAADVGSVLETFETRGKPSRSEVMSNTPSFLNDVLKQYKEAEERGEASSFKKWLKDIEERVCQDVWNQQGGNKAKAARFLGYNDGTFRDRF